MKLQHKRVGTEKNLTTFGVNTVVIPLVTDTGLDHLNYSFVQKEESISSSTTTYNTILETELTVTDSGAVSSIYVATSFNANASSAQVGQWQFQYKKSTSSDWLDMGNPTKRAMSGIEDTGVVTLYGLQAGLKSATYNVRLVGKTLGTLPITSSKVSLAVLSLLYKDSSEKDMVFGSISVLSDGGSCTPDGPDLITGTSSVLEVEDPIDYFVAMSFTAKKSDRNDLGDFNISLMNGTTLIEENQVQQRYLSSHADIASGGSVALFSDIPSGSYTIEGHHAIEYGFFTTCNVNLVGFSGTSQSPLTSPVVAFSALVDDGILTFSMEDEIGVLEYQIFSVETGELIGVVPAVNKNYSFDLPEGVMEVRVKVIDARGFSQSFFPLAGNLVKVLYDLQKGWNLIAMPGDHADLTALKGVTSGDLWSWSGISYEAIETPEVCQGIWVYATKKVSVTIEAEKSKAEITLKPHWNLVGPTKNVLIPEEAIAVYGWNETYEMLASDHGVLIQGIGYWIFSL